MVVVVVVVRNGGGGVQLMVTGVWCLWYLEVVVVIVISTEMVVKW